MKLNCINPRLLAVSRMVRPGSVCADIGTDHGYLACYLAANGISPKVFACDVNEKPLAAARSNILSMGLENHVETVLTAGLKGLPIDEINDIVMAGMGGELIAGMIAACPAARDRRIQFILQPMTKAERLRPRLCQMGFEIAKEEGVLSGGIFYTVMNVFYTGVISGPDMLYAWTGKLHQSKTPESRGMLIKIRGRLLEIANGLDCSRGGGRPFEYRDVISKIDSLLEGKNDIYG